MDVARRVGCVPSTICKAIRKSPLLQDWQDRSRHKTPRAQSINDVVQDTEPSKFDDPAKTTAENERLDNDFARLVQEAKPEKRAKLNAMPLEDCRHLARLRIEQRQEQHTEDIDEAGNRLLDRKP